MPTVVIGLIGSNLDSGDGAERWNRWRPTVSLCQHEELLIDRLELLYQRRDSKLVESARDDIRSVSPETEVRPHELAIRDPWSLLLAGRGSASVQRLAGAPLSRRLESGWEVDNGRLFLAPTLFDELLLVQYLVSRSHRAGGLTLEGRYTLPELFARLRNAGYLRAVGIHAQNPADALEQLVTVLGGGEAAIKFYHVVDRRDFLEKVKSLKHVTPPKPRVHPPPTVRCGLIRSAGHSH